MGRYWSRGTKFQVHKMSKFGDLIYINMNVVNNIVFCSWNLLTGYIISVLIKKKEEGRKGEWKEGRKKENGNYMRWCCSLVTELCSTLLRPHGLEPARLFCPWNFPGKNPGEGGHFFLQGILTSQGSNRHLISFIMVIISQNIHIPNVTMVYKLYNINCTTFFCQLYLNKYEKIKAKPK